MIRLKRLYAHDFKQLREIELIFPEAGRVLVQGKNEAGKSTLFEAIFFALFGQALATESVGRPNLEDLIGYEKNKARVELDLAVRDRLLRITRTLNRGKANVWELDISREETREEIRGNKPVNARLVAELGFDAEALLNTCFVEQKKLEKLEGLNKSKRDESLSKLLNLERLLDLEEKLRLRTEDEKMLARLNKRVELAEAQQELPSAEEDLNKTEGQLKLIELRAQVTRAVEEKRAALGLREQLREMQVRREELRGAAAAADALDKARQVMANALDRFDFLAQQTASLEAMRREREETERAAQENMPALDRRARGLRRLARHLTRLDQIETARGSAKTELVRLKSVQQELSNYLVREGELNDKIDQQEARAKQLEMLLHDYDVGEALGEWATLAAEVRTDAIGERAVDETKHTREQALARLRVGLIAPGVVLAVLIAATVLIPLLLLYLTRDPVLAAVAGGGMLVADAAIAIILIRHAISLWDGLERATAELGKAQGEFAARGEISATHAERFKTAQARLGQMGVLIPSTPEAAQSRRIEIAARLENKTPEELKSEREAALERLNYARAERDQVAKHAEDLRAALSTGDDVRFQRRVEKFDRILGHWRDLLAGHAAALQVQPDQQGVREARQDVENQRKLWQARIQQASKLDEQIKEGDARTQKIWGELQASYESARALLNGHREPLSANLGRSTYVDLGRALSEAFEAHGGDQVHARLNSQEKAIGACEGELKLRDKAGHDAIALSHAILKDLGISDTLSPQPAVEELDELAARLQIVQFEDKPKLESRVRTLQMRVGVLRETRDRLERDLGLQGEVVDREAAREELEKERRRQEERRHGAEMVLRARKRIVQKVLPATMDYMRRILPQLTRDRYHDAELDPETYKIKVWDERAGQSGAWKEKNIFSGGTKDQFSLALRLAFALATLPQERGTSPGFIFLDEPLGSFDDERAAALLYLLTEGEVARAFDQIFLISHVRVQEDRFTHQIRLENGAVVESSL